MMLTDTAIKRATVGEQDYKMADAGGLFVLVTAAGASCGVGKYRYEGKEKKMSFGRYPEMTLAEIRVLHAAARRLLVSGIDPMSQRSAEKRSIRESNELPFLVIATKWHEHWKGGNSAHHVKATWSRLETNVFPAIGDRLITEIKVNGGFDMMNHLPLKQIIRDKKTNTPALNPRF